MTEIRTMMATSYLGKLVLEPEQMLSLGEEAMAQQKLGEFKQAALTYEQAIKENPTSFDLYFNLGVCLDNSEEIDAAILAFKSALLLQPEDKPTLLRLTSLYIERGEREESMKYWARYESP